MKFARGAWQALCRSAARGARARRFRRLQPFDDDFGWGRGTPVDRIYIESFLHSVRHLISGDVLEVQDSRYTRCFGTNVASCHVVDRDPANLAATMIVDLCEAGSLPRSAFDAVILTQTLQLLPNPRMALRNLWQSLRPDGSLLITAPCASKLAYDDKPGTDFWRWTPDGLRLLLTDELAGSDVRVHGQGNLLAVVAFLVGLAAEELERRDLVINDVRYPLIVTASARKPSGRD